MKNKGFAVISGTMLLLAAIVIYWLGFPSLDNDSTRLSAIILVGLALTVVFMAILAIIYAVMGTEDKKQALALPEGSVRALLAFSLVLIFVCLSSFLFSEINKNGHETECKTLLADQTQLDALKANADIVIVGRAQDKDGNLLYEKDLTDPKAPKDDPKKPIFSVNYYPKKSAAQKDAQDFAKQIFTTLATVFVSVVSFYFGSKTASSAGSKTPQGPVGDETAKAAQSALAKARADLAKAQTIVDQALRDRDKAKTEFDNAPEDQQKKDAFQKAMKTLDDANKDLQDKQKKVDAAQKTVNDATAPNANIDNANA